jgi:DNA invertase Pin-like site-specific DNA recombinase
MLHLGKKRGNLSAATRAGLARAKARGVQLGHKTGTHFTTKKSIKAKAVILNESKDFYGESSDTSVMESCGVSRNTYYKYKSELKEEIAKGIDVRDKYAYKETTEQIASSLSILHSCHFNHLYNY